MKINQLKAGSVLSYLSLFLGTVVSLVYTPIMIERLGTSEYGVYSLVLPVVSYLNLFTFGLGSAYTRFYTRYKESNDRYGMAKLNGMFIIIYTVLGTLVAVVGCIIAGYPRIAFGSELTQEELDIAVRLMYIMTFTAAVNFPVSVFESNIMVNERYVFLKLMAFAKSVINPLLIIPMLMIGMRSEAIAYMSLAFAIVSGVLEIYYCFAKLKMKINFSAFDFRLLREMTRFTGWVFIGIVVDQLNWNVDKILLGHIRGSESVAIYNIASQLNIYYMSMATTFSAIFTPRVHQMVVNNEPNKKISDLFIRVGRFQFVVLIMVLLGFVAVGYPFVIFWVGEQNTAAFVIALLLFIPTILPSIQNLGIEIQRAKNMHHFRSVTYLIVSVVNILLSIPLCMAFGEIGVAIGTAIPVFVGNGLLMNWYYNKYIGLDIPRFWRRIGALLPSMMIPAAVALIIGIFVPITSLWMMVLFGAIFVAVYVVFVWNAGLTPREKEIVTTPMKKMIGRLLEKILG
ncbi:MAG: oligosaccharide flippase family protein [Eubacterium sp.]|nr:oligosaccharide flippase family protein [Eubacterium sp.]